MPDLVARRYILGLLPAAALGACAADPTPPAPATVAPAAASTPEPAPLPTREPDALIEIDKGQVSFIGSAAWGSGTLIYQGRRYPIRVRGIGIGGVGAARVRATGEVFNMPRLADFNGLYGQLRAGAVLGDTQVRGGIWLQNPAGVRLNLQPRRTGLALQIGADGVLIQLR